MCFLKRKKMNGDYRADHYMTLMSMEKELYEKKRGSRNDFYDPFGSP